MLDLKSFNLEYQTSMLGAASFDLSGLPKDYFIRVEGSQTIAWVQTIFQVIGVRSLLASSLKLEGFSHSLIRGSQNAALVVRQPNGYMAILYELDYQNLSNSDLISWAKQLNANQIKRDRSFKVV
jgi:hypothetical protein